FERHLLKQGIHNFLTMELWSVEAIKQTVMSGLGISILPYITVKEEDDSGKLKILSHSEKLDTIYSHMLTKKKKWLLPSTEAFVELVQNSINAPPDTESVYPG